MYYWTTRESHRLVVSLLDTVYDKSLTRFHSLAGEITIAKSLRSHGDNVIKLRIDATDGGQKSSKSSATVTINIINSTIASVGGPVFSESHYSFTIREDASSGDFVGTVLADAKGEKVNFISILFYAVGAIGIVYNEWMDVKNALEDNQAPATDT